MRLSKKGTWVRIPHSPFSYLFERETIMAFNDTPVLQQFIKLFKRNEKKHGNQSDAVQVPDAPIFNIETQEDVDTLLEAYAKSQKRLMVPIDDYTLIIRSSNDNQRHLVLKRFTDGRHDEILASDGYFGFQKCGDIKETIWNYRDIINRYFTEKSEALDEIRQYLSPNHIQGT